MYSTILSVLLEPHSTVFATAQFRFWSKRMFRLVATPHANIVTHENRPVAVKNQIYNILVGCHGDAAHGGRDKTSAQVRRFYSWIPKELVSRFVKMCPLCIQKRRSQKPYLSDSLLPEPYGAEFPVAFRRPRPPITFNEDPDSPEEYASEENTKYSHQHHQHHQQQQNYIHQHEQHQQPQPQGVDGLNPSYDYTFFDLPSPTSQGNYEAPLASMSYSGDSKASSSSSSNHFDPSQLQIHPDHVVIHDPSLPPYYGDSSGGGGAGIPSFSLMGEQLDFSQALARWNAESSYNCDSFRGIGDEQQNQLLSVYALPPNPMEFQYGSGHFEYDGKNQTGYEHSDEEETQTYDEKLQPVLQPWDNVGADIETQPQEQSRSTSRTGLLSYRRAAKPPPLDLGRTSNLFPSFELLRLASAGLPPDNSTGYEGLYSAPIMQGSQSQSSLQSNHHLYPYSLHSPGPLSACSSNSLSSSGLSMPLTPSTGSLFNPSPTDPSEVASWQQTSKDLAQAIQNLLDSTDHSHISDSGVINLATSVPMQSHLQQQYEFRQGQPSRERQRTRTRTMSANLALSPTAAMYTPTVERRGSASHALDLDRTGLRTPRREESRYSPY